MKFTAAVFDLDGTLLNTLTDLTDSVNHMLSNHGYPTRTQEEIRRFLGSGGEHLIRCALPQGTETEVFQVCYREYLTYYQGHSEIRTAPYPGILPLLNRLKQDGVKLAIVSNKGNETVKTLTKRYFSEYISVAVGERPGVRRKPAPDSVLEAMKQIGAVPEETVFVGDSEVDGETARNAGLAWAAAGWGFRDREELMKLDPQIYLSEPEDLYHWRMF